MNENLGKHGYHSELGKHGYLPSGYHEETEPIGDLVGLTEPPAKPDLLPLALRRVAYGIAIVLGVAGIVLGAFEEHTALAGALIAAGVFVSAQAGIALAHPTKVKK